MLGRDLRCLLSAAALIGCGSSSAQDLFGSRGGKLTCSPGMVEACELSSGCPAHRFCPDKSTVFGPCTCDPSSTGGASGGGGGDFSTGGMPPVTGGFGGGLFPSTGGGGGVPSESGGAGGSAPAVCPAQSFTGTATGSNYNSSLGLKVDVKATLAFSVSETGTIQGTYTGVSPGKSNADLSGSMNCATLAVTITLANGSYPASLFPPNAGGTFTGTLTGDFSTAGSSFSGQWTITEGNPAYGGQGSWTAN